MGTTSELAKLNAVGKGGADINLPDRGTSTGLQGDTYGADISINATNREGGISGSTKSAEAFERCPGEC